MLILLDLDNTLVDRAGAFASWCRTFAVEHGGDAGDIAALIAADDNGYAPRRAVAEHVRRQFPDAGSVAEVIEQLLFGHLDRIELYEGVRASLDRLVAAGAMLIIVTNGTTAQQTRKIERVGLGEVVSHAVISESVGMKKPDRGIFVEALSRGGPAASEAWMVGDHPTADITGAAALGIRTAWVSHGTLWPGGPAPTLIGRRTSDVLDAIASSR